MKPSNVSEPHEPLYIAYLSIKVLSILHREMNVPTLQLPDDDDTLPQISIRRSASAPIYNISDGARRTREGSTSNMSSQ